MHFHANAPFIQKRATLTACLRKVNRMASDTANLYVSALDKVAEFRRLRALNKKVLSWSGRVLLLLLSMVDRGKPDVSSAGGCDYTQWSVTQHVLLGMQQFSGGVSVCVVGGLSVATEGICLTTTGYAVIIASSGINLPGAQLDIGGWSIAEDAAGNVKC